MAVLFIFAGLIQADGGFTVADQEDILRGRIILPSDALAKQNSYTFLIELNIGEGWHINSHEPLEEFLIPTEVNLEETDGISYGKLVYQHAELRNFSFSETQVSVFEGKAYVRATVTINPDYAGEELVMRGTVYYQACNDESCLAPAEITVTKLVDIVAADSEIAPANQDVFDQTSPGIRDRG